LEARGYEVEEAENGLQALQQIAARPPDVILLDLMMPKMDGFEVLAGLRADPASREIPVLVVSARREDADKVMGLNLGAVDYLEKPFSVAELRARVARTGRALRSQRALRALAETDHLTGLGNRRALEARLELEHARARRYRTPLSCVMADVDGLKAINDELGHAAGDRAIVTVAWLLREELRETDFAGRFGGDEFVVLLPHTAGTQGRVFADRVSARLGHIAFEVAGHRVPLRASFGVACMSSELPKGGEELLLEADRALYRAKGAGKGRVEGGASDVAPPAEA
jgi:diguanylate cyclase (GGDEF)-like protein